MNFFKITLIIFALSGLLLKTSAQNSYCWAKSADAPGNVRYQDVAVDQSSGDVYSVGFFNSNLSAHFPSGINNTPDLSTTYGGEDGFVAKYDSEGNEMWAFKIGGTLNDKINGVAVDTFGNIYITGTFSGAANFAGVTTSQVIIDSSHGGTDAFLAKYNSNGNLIWVRIIGGTFNDEANDVAVNSTGVFITGAFEGVFFTQGFSPMISNGVKDVFAIAFNLNGNYRWLRQAGGVSGPGAFLFDDEGIAIVADENNVYVTGTFFGAIEFPDPPALLLQAYVADLSTIFIAEYNAQTGARTWEDIIGGDFHNEVNGIAIDSNTIYLAGGLEGTVLFPGGTLLLSTSGGGSEIFSCAIDRFTKNTSWAAIENNNVFNDAAANDIIVDSKNSAVYITGYYEGATGFNGGADTRTTLGGQDVFIMSRSSAGNFMWVETAGIGASNEQGVALSTDLEGSIYLNGWYQQGITLGTYTLPNGTFDDAFISKLNCKEDTCENPPSFSNAGEDQVLYGINSTNLSGNPPLVGLGFWRRLSGNGSIINPNNQNSFVENLSEGENIFEWVISNEEGLCESSRDEVVVTVNPLIIPNLFSPNGDGENDFFIVPGLDLLDNEVIIFDRWGVKLYRNINYQNDWDGKDELGGDLPEDTYFYIIKVTDTNEKINGFITLKR